MSVPVYVPKDIVDSIARFVVEESGEPKNQFDNRVTQSLNGRKVFYYDALAPTKCFG